MTVFDLLLGLGMHMPQVAPQPRRNRKNRCKRLPNPKRMARRKMAEASRKRNRKP